MTSLNEQGITNLLSLIGGTTVMVVTLRPVGSTEEYDVVVSENDAILAEALIQAAYDGTIVNNGIQHNLVKVSISSRKDLMSIPQEIKSWTLGPQAKPKMNEAIERDQQYQEAVGEAVELVKAFSQDWLLSTNEPVSDDMIRESLFRFLKGASDDSDLDRELSWSLKPHKNLLQRLI